MNISIITAVMNRENTIFDCIQSLRNQTFDNIEHVIQDGGSTDRTIEIIKQSSIVNTNFVTEPDIGIYDALNRGIVRCSGDIIGVLHSDDILAEIDTLEKVIDAFSDKTVDGVYGDLDYVAFSDTSKILRKWRAGNFSKNMLRRGWMPPHPTLFLRRDVFTAFGSYDARMQISGDYEAMMRYLILGNINLHYIPEVLVKMRVGGASNGSLRKLLLKTKEDYEVIRRYKLGGIKTLTQKKLSKLHQIQY